MLHGPACILLHVCLKTCTIALIIVQHVLSSNSQLAPLPCPPPRLSSSRTLSASSFAFLLLCLRSDSPLYLLQLVIYGVDGVFQTPPAVPFGQALVQYLEYILMPGGAEVPAQLIVDLVTANQTDEVAAAFDEAVSAGYSQQLVAILQQVCSLVRGRH